MIQNRDTGTGALQLLGFTLHTPASSTGLALNMIGIQGLGGGPRESSKLSTKGNFMGGNFIRGESRSRRRWGLTRGWRMRGSQKLIVTAHPPGMRARTRSGALGLADSCACDCHIALHAQAHPHPYAITERATNRVAPVANRTATLNLPNSSSLLDCPGGGEVCAKELRKA